MKTTTRLKKKFKKIKAAISRSRYGMLALFIAAFAAIGGLVVLNLRAAPGLCSTTGVVGTASFAVNAPETAQYRLWVRMQVPDTTNTNNTNGVRVELSGSSNQCFTVTTTNSGAVNQWMWVNSDALASSTPLVTSQISAGIYTAKILGLKTGVKVDKVLLLKSDNTCIPSNDSTNGQPGENCTTSPPTVTLTANPTSVTSGGSVTLNWSSTDATSCTASGTGSGWTGTKATSGSQTLTNRTTTQSYTLTCTGIGGTGSDTQTVTVTAPATPTVTLSASPTTVTSGNPSTLTWSSTNATTCTASGGWTGTKALSGSQSTGNLTSNQTFTLTCTGAGGSANATTSVTVTSSPPAVDSLAPTITFNIPGVTLTSTQTSVVVRDQKGVTWQPIAADNTAVTSLELKLNGQVVAGTSVQVGVSANGDYVVEATAKDAAGNTTVKTLTIQVRHPDFNRSGSITIQDVSALLNRWNTSSTVYDINVNGKVDLSDLSYTLNRWGSTN